MSALLSQPDCVRCLDPEVPSLVAMGSQTIEWKALSTGEVSSALGVDRSPSALVGIDRSQLERIGLQIQTRPEFNEYSRATWDDDHFWNAHDPLPKRSQYYAIGNAINFRFWALDGGQMVPSKGTLDGKEYRGAMFMWRALRRELDRSGGELLSASTLAELTREQFDSIFRDDKGAAPLEPAADDRVENLRDLGRQLLSRWDGSFFNVVDASGGSLVEFARLCGDFRAYDDPIYKLTMLTAILHSGSRVYVFNDQPLPAIDYHLLRHALRQGILRPVEPLARKLRHDELLSTEEAIELRRVALGAFVALSERTGLSGELLDNKFWLNRVKCTDTDPVCLDPATATECPFYGACIQAVDFGRPLELTRYY